MELESCQNLTHTQNVFYSHPTIHKQTQCGLQIQNITHKLMHFVLQIKNVPIKQIQYVLHTVYKETYYFNDKNILQVQTKIFQVQNKILQVQNKITKNCHVTFGTNFPPC